MLRRFFHTILTISAIVILTSCNREKKSVNPAYGLVFDEEKYAQVPLRATYLRRDYENLPSSVSLKKYAPIVGDQGQYGTCSVWSSVYGARTMLESIAISRTNKSLTTKNAFSPMFVYKNISSDSTCSSGLCLGDVFHFLYQTGAPKILQTELTSDAASFSVKQYSGARTYTIGDYIRLFTPEYNNRQKITAIKKSLSEKHPVIVGMKIPSDFSNIGNVWISENSTWSEAGNHAMLVVGYDDNAYGGAFELMNSWGQYWAHNGYAWIRYKDMASYSFEAYEISENPELYSDTIGFSANVELVTYSGEKMPAKHLGEGFYRIENTYHSGTLFRLFITNKDPAYVYAFASDKKTGKTTVIFPYGQNISPSLDYRGSTIAYPSEDDYIQMDETTGEDYLIILFSKKKLAIDKICNTYEKSQGNFQNKVSKAVGYNLMKPLDSNYSENKIQFSATSHNSNSVSCILIAIPHD